MPGYKGHIAGAVVAFSLMLLVVTHYYQVSFLTSLQWFLITVAGALFPDVDIKSKGQGIFYRILFLILLFLYIRGQWRLGAALGVIGMIPLLVRHRGLFHKPLFIIVLAGGLVFFGSSWWPCYTALFTFNACFFITGALSHIFLDRIT